MSKVNFTINCAKKKSESQECHVVTFIITMTRQKAIVLFRLNFVVFCKHKHTIWEKLNFISELLYNLVSYCEKTNHLKQMSFV